ncbi:MAG: hypothetical protein MR871_03455 [Lachnospiraceae bacterium]|nr:hypothetical protein [Lachnospiraceae bacterium]
MNSTQTDQLSKKKKSIRITLSLDEYQILMEQALQQHCPLNQYISHKILDDKLGVKLLSDRIMQMMPLFYNIIAGINDTSIRNELTEFGGAICRYLK